MAIDTKTKSVEKIGPYLLGAILLLAGCEKKAAIDPPSPNIVWIMLEDWGLQLSCYGEPGISTPNVDQLASEGVRYINAFTTAPVCSPSRSSMMTGFYQNYIRAHQHRTGEKFGFPKKPLPESIKPIVNYLKEKGYHTALMQDRKTDLNFTHDSPLFDSHDWADRREGQPFFAQVTFGGTHRKWRRDSIRPVPITDVRVPPYYPQTDFVKRDWANGLEAMQIVDRQIGKLLDRLEEEGLAENTLVFLVGDNGRCMPRGKQFLYDGGIQVPLIIRWPGEISPDSVSSDLVSTIDIPKTILDIIGAKPKEPLHGKNLFNGEVGEQEFIYAARDKMDSTHDASRAVRSEKYKLIHNLMPERPYLQFNEYKELYYPTLAQMNVLYLQGRLNKDQETFMAARKPEFELYDLANDPYELNNLAFDPAYADTLDHYLAVLTIWREKVRDEGVSEAFREGGWPDTFPTRTLEEWQKHMDGFVPWVFRDPSSSVKHPYGKW